MNKTETKKGKRTHPGDALSKPAIISLTEATPTVPSPQPPAPEP